jgi:hypothetical protein
MPSNYPLARETVRVLVYQPKARTASAHAVLVTFDKEVPQKGYSLVETLELEVPKGMKKLWLDKWKKTTAHARVPGTDIYTHSVREIVEHAPKVLGFVLESLVDEFLDIGATLGLVEARIRSCEDDYDLDRIEAALQGMIESDIAEQKRVLAGHPVDGGDKEDLD